MKLSVKISLLSIVVAAACPVCFAQAPLTLQECLSIGLERNYDIRIIRNKEMISDNNLTLGNAGYFPQADIYANYNGSLNNTNSDLREGGSISTNNASNQSLGAGLNVSWSIFEGFSIRTNYQRLEELKAIGELNTRLQIESFITDFTSEYYNYIRQYQRLKNLKYAVELSSERLRIVEARYSIGALSRLDLQQANVDLNSDKSKLVKQYEVLHSIYTGLNAMMAKEEIDKPLKVADSTIYYERGIARDDIWQSAMRRNIYLELARSQNTLSELELRAVKSKNYPYLRFNTGYGYTGSWYNTGTYNNQQNAGLTYGLTMGITIFDGLNQRRRERNARLDIDIARLEYAKTELSLREDLSNAWMAYRNNIELTELEQVNLAIARDYYDIAIERYKLGQLSGLELREAQNSLLEAEERLVQAQFDTKLCEITLYFIGGEITRYLDI